MIRSSTHLLVVREYGNMVVDVARLWAVMITIALCLVCCRSDLGGADVYGADFSNALLDRTQQLVSEWEGRHRATALNVLSSAL